MSRNIDKEKLLEQLQIEYFFKYMSCQEMESIEDFPKRILKSEGFLNAMKIVCNFKAKEMKIPLKILESNNCQYSLDQENNILNAMEEYGKQQYNQAIDDVLQEWDKYIKVTKEDIEKLRKWQK